MLFQFRYRRYYLLSIVGTHFVSLSEFSFLIKKQNSSTLMPHSFVKLYNINTVFKKSRKMIRQNRDIASKKLDRVYPWVYLMTWSRSEKVNKITYLYHELENKHYLVIQFNTVRKMHFRFQKNDLTKTSYVINSIRQTEPVICKVGVCNNF